MTPGSASRRLISSNRSSSFSSLRLIESFMAANYSDPRSDPWGYSLGGLLPVTIFDEHASERLRQRRIGRFGGPPQRLGRGMQQPIGQGMGEIVNDLMGGIAGSQHAPGLLHGLQADRVRLVAQRPDGGSRIMYAGFGQETRHFFFEQQSCAASRDFPLLTVLIDELPQIVD